MRHHPSETTLLTYVAGGLPAPHAQLVMLHAALCSQCADEIRLLEAAGGAFVCDLPPAPLAPDALGRMMARLDDEPVAIGEPVKKRGPVTPAAIISSLATGRWRWSGPGIRLMPLLKRDSSDTRLDLIQVAPDTGLLQHGHTGFETTIVLQGAFHDGVDRYGIGDFAEAAGGLNHRPMALAGPDCICLIAMSGHLSARGLLGRLVRPLLGM
jgi:putative transcriptional regulator